MEVTHIKKHVAIFMRELAGGGAERIMVNLALGLADDGVKLDLVLAHRRGPYLSDVPANVNLVDLRANRWRRAVLLLAQYLRRERPTALLSAMPHTNVAAITAVKLARTRTRVGILEVNRITEADAYNSGSSNRLLRQLARLMYPHADRVFSLSKGVADDVSLHYRIPCEQVHVVYSPVTSPSLLKLSAEPIDCPWLNDSALPVLLTVGRLVPQKDHATLLRAFARVRERRSVRLIILGEGELRCELEDLAKSMGLFEDIAMPGFVSNPFAYMAGTNCFVLSSRWEGFGNVLVEAMACGAPVVSTDCPSGPSEILKEGKFGPLVPVGDDEGLAEAIEQVLESPPSSAALRERAAAFSIHHIAKEYRRLLLDE